MPSPSAGDLLARGLFHDRIVPPISSLKLSWVMDDLLAFARAEMNKKSDGRRRSRLVRHSVPKMKHLRRHFGIPNPYSQSMLCIAVAENWNRLDELCKKSSVALSRPIPSSRRAVASEHSRRVEGVQRSHTSIGRRFMLKADIASFYPSIYTHSIPWAIHGKEVARSKRARSWYGNQLDTWMRETQDRQTGGIPIGPDTSFLVAEVIASRMDVMLEKLMKQKLRGVRYIDDYHLYFRTRAEAEKALAALHVVTRSFELQINGPKTEIIEIPEPIQPEWKTELRLIRILSDGRATGVKAFFDRASSLAQKFPGDSVLTYAVRKIAHRAAGLNDTEWEVVRSSLLRFAMAEPTMLPALLELFGKNDKACDRDGLRDVLAELCFSHAPLQHGFEVAWSLWMARTLSIALPESVSAAVRNVDDDIVALVALDLEQQNLLPPTNSRLWASRMTKEHLYSEHWLVAYEACAQGWLAPSDGNEFLSADPFFSILSNGDVRFYDSGDTWEEGYSDYTDGDDETVDLDEDDDDGNTAPEEEAPGGDILPGGPPAELELPLWPAEQV
jgi:hypothetical protein